MQRSPSLACDMLHCGGPAPSNTEQTPGLMTSLKSRTFEFATDNSSRNLSVRNETADAWWRCCLEESAAVQFCWSVQCPLHIRCWMHQWTLADETCGSRRSISMGNMRGVWRPGANMGSTRHAASPGPIRIANGFRCNNGLGVASVFRRETFTGGFETPTI